MKTEDDSDGGDVELLETTSLPPPPHESNELECHTTTATITTNATAGPTTSDTTQDVTASTGLSQNQKKRGYSVSYSDVKKPRIDSCYSSGGDCGGSSGGGCGSGGDCRKLFLLSLLTDVNAMTDVQMRKFRKLVLDAIDTVLDEASNGHT